MNDELKAVSLVGLTCVVLFALVVSAAMWEGYREDVKYRRAMDQCRSHVENEAVWRRCVWGVDPSRGH